jgi:DNA-binding SARP family transcriptional activator
MEVRVLGPLEVRDNGESVPLGPRKQRALLARLALDADHVVPVEQLIDDLWGEDVPPTANKMIQIYVSQLRKVLPEGILRTSARGYMFSADGVEVDVARFQDLRAEARRALAANDAAGAGASLHEALELWRGSSLAEFDEPFARAEAARMEELRLACLEERIEADLAAGRAADLVAELEALVVQHPLRERLRRHLMLALYRSGRQADALSAYQDFRRMLDEELGLEPSSALRDMERSILLHEAAVDSTPAAATTASPAPAAPPVTGLIDREAELTTVRRLLADAQAGRRSAAFLSGEPGAGKRALLEAFLGGARGNGPLLVARGQCIEQPEAGEPYLAVLDALSRLVSGEGAEAAVQVLAARAPTWMVQIPWALEPEQMERVHMRAKGATRERMLREMVEAVEALSALTTVVFVLEDLHFADPSTLALLRALVSRRGPARVLVIGTFQASAGPAAPDSAQQLARQLCAASGCENIVLGPISLPAVRQWLAVRFPGPELPAEVAQTLCRRTHGNPLFVRMLIDHWLGDGKLVEDAGGARLAVPVAALDEGVPGTLREVIEDKLALEESVARFLRAAAVVGREFTVPVVATVIREPEAKVADVLDWCLRGPGVIRGRDPLPWPDGRRAARYAFANVLYHEVVYDTVPLDRRAELHARVAAALEKAYGARSAEVAPALAHHFLRAGDPRNAVRFLKLAAERAFDRNAHAEGIALLRDALAAAQELPADVARMRSEVEIWSELGQATVAVEGWSAPAAEEALLHARSLAEQLHDNEPLISVLLALATLYEVRGEYSRAEAIAEAATALQPEARGGKSLESHELLACSLFHQGSFARSLEHANRGVELSASELVSGDYSTFPATLGDNAGVSCHDWAGLALWFLGCPDRALERARHALELASAPERAYSLATAQAQLAVLSQCRQEPEETLRWAQATIESASEMGYAYRVAQGQVLRGWALAREGNCDEAVESIVRGLRGSRATGAHMDDPYYLAMLAEAYLLAGELEPGFGAIRQAFDIAGEQRSSYYEPELHRLHGALLAETGEIAGAGAAIRRAISYAREQSSRSLELRAALSLARLWSEEGRGVEARSYVAEAFDAFDEGFDTPDLVEAAGLLGREMSPRGA